MLTTCDYILIAFELLGYKYKSSKDYSDVIVDGEKDRSMGISGS
jgi:hypothetical protein